MLLSPYLNSHAFYQMVFNNSEQRSTYEFVLPLAQSVNVLLCPTAIFLLFLKFTSYTKLNREILVMFLGLVFSVFIIFVNPMPGRAIWSLPFIIYFYLSNKEYSKAPFILYNLIYIIYFLLFFENNTLFLHKNPIINLINNLSVSLLIASVVFIIMWMMQIGIKRNEELKIKEKPLLVGIGGDSSTGKHTTFNALKMLIGGNSCIPVFGDNFHKWERDNQNWKVFTHLNPMSNKLHEELDLAIALKEGNQIELIEYDHAKGKFTNPKIVEASKFIFFIGLHPFYLKSMRDLIDIKIFMEADEDLRCFWKIKRDVAERGYKKSKVVEQIDSRLEDNKKFIQPQKDFADLIIKFIPLDKIDNNNPAIDKIPFKVVYKLDNSINLDNLINDLSKVKSLSAQLFPLDDLIHQEICIEGSISSQNITSVVHNLELNFDELLISNPNWESDYAGITQLIFLIIYNHKMRAK